MSNQFKKDLFEESLCLVCAFKKIRQITQKKVKTDIKYVLYKKIVLLVSSRKINVYPKGAFINDVRIQEEGGGSKNQYFSNKGSVNDNWTR